MKNIKLTNYTFGKTNVLFIYNNTGMDSPSYKQIAKYNKLNAYFLEIYDPSIKTYSDYLSLAKSKNINIYLTEYYKYILDLIKIKDIKIVLILCAGYPYTKEFIENLKKKSFVAAYFADDPEGSFKTSKYWVKYYDVAFCGGVYYNSKQKITQKYIEFGAKEAHFIPLGVRFDKYNKTKINLKNREIPIIFIGSNPIKRLLRMILLKIIFKGKLHIYGSFWNYHEKMNPLKKIIMFFLYPLFKNAKKIETNDELINIYQNAKIGINLHLSYGPSNIRSYELPINGVMQIADNSKGFSELYNLNKEIVCCDNVFQMIKKINYYLKHDDERIKIAKAGYEKTKNKYLVEETYKNLFNIVYNNKNYKKKINGDKND